MDTAQAEAPAPPPPLPGLPRRLVDVVVAPGRLFERLREQPRWAAAVAVGALLVLVATWLIPVDVWNTFTREQIAARGMKVPEGFNFGTMQKVFGAVGGVVGWLFMLFVLTAILTFVFAFVLGDEGSYKQYLAVVGHAFFIPALGSLLVTPLRIAQGDPSLTLNLSLFAVGLDPSLYPVRVLRVLDLFQIWAWVLVAVGAHAIDRRRSVGSAAVVTLGLALLLALVFGIFAPAAT